MDTKNPPAFPYRHFDLADGEQGMSLRDYFAGQALAGLCANPGGPYQANSYNGWDLVNVTQSDVAHVAYNLADAMLEDRSASLAMGG